MTLEKINKLFTIVFPKTITSVGYFFISQLFKPVLTRKTKELIIKNMRVQALPGAETQFRQFLTNL